MPLPGDRIFHPAFQRDWQPTIVATFRSQVVVTRLADRAGTRDFVTNRVSYANPWVLYEGPARMQSRSAGEASSVASRIITVAPYLVALPANVAEVKVDDLVKVLSCPDDRALEGLTLKVVEVPHSDIAWQRSLGCDLHEPSARG